MCHGEVVKDEEYYLNVQSLEETETVGLSHNPIDTAINKILERGPNTLFVFEITIS